jgi:cysteine desulfurase
VSRAYLDHASTTPLRPEARAALVEWLDVAGDPGRIHAEGLTTRVAVEQARDQVAALLGARNREVVFTSGATEAIAAACWGAAARVSSPSHQVVPAVEHSAVRLTAARHGDVTLVPVDGAGRVAPEDVMAAVRPDTALVHVQWGNHEVGTVQPVAEVVAACRERGVPVHVDAAQAAGRVPIDFDGLGADLLSVSAHKLGGPLGIGALLVRRGVRLPPLLVGGDQERARRAGLENVPAVVGFGAAAAALAAPGALDGEAAEQRRLTDRVRSAVESVPGLDGLVVYGPAEPEARLPHLVCLGVAGIEPQAVLLGLDRAGIAAHSGSACSSESLEPSPVLEAMGVDAHPSRRDALPRVLAELRALARRA